MDNRRVFVMIKNGKCGTCVMLEKSCWGTADKPGELRQLVAKHYQLIEIHLPTWNDKIGPTYPHYLRTRVGYFPFVAIFSAESWRKALREPNVDHTLEGEVYGARMDDKGIWRSTNTDAYTSDAIQEWAGLKPRSTNGAAPTTHSRACDRRAILKEMPK